MIVRDVIPAPENSSNFNAVADAKTEPGTTVENLKAAVCGETGASAKYAAYAAKADEEGFAQAAKLFRAASAAEQIHIELEAGLVAAAEPDYQRPVADEVVAGPTDLNLIDAAYGEIFETSDMYPSFIAKAQEEDNAKAVRVFTRAKLAESVHAEKYLEAYNNLDAADSDDYFLCPVCGYIEKGEGAEKCPICGCPAAKFQRF